MSRAMNLVVLGRSITSSWGNSHATIYRALLRALAQRGHHITFLERESPQYAQHRDLPQPPYCRTYLYTSLEQLAAQHDELIADADAVIVGSYVPQGIEVGQYVLSRAAGIRAFYDLQTPLTVENMVRGKCEYLSPQLIAEYDLYLSFAGGPILQYLQDRFGSPLARALYGCVDAQQFMPPHDVHDADPAHARWDLGYLGTYSRDRQPPLDMMLLETARRLPRSRFMVAGATYPANIAWPANVQHVEHIPAAQLPAFYHNQRFTLNLTRADMRVAGYCPNVRLFEAAACGTPIISDTWLGLEDFFTVGRDLFTAASTAQVLQILHDTPQQQREQVAAAARRRVLAEHTAEHRASQLEAYLKELHREADDDSAANHRQQRLPLNPPRLRKVAD